MAGMLRLTPVNRSHRSLVMRQFCSCLITGKSCHHSRYMAVGMTHSVASMEPAAAALSGNVNTVRSEGSLGGRTVNGRDWPDRADRDKTETWRTFHSADARSDVASQNTPYLDVLILNNNKSISIFSTCISFNNQIICLLHWTNNTR